MSKLYIDIETFSDRDLKKTGVYSYCESEQFEILMAAWAVDDEPVRIAVGEAAIRLIPGLANDRVIKVAHNASFERVCFSRFFGLPTGRYLDPSCWNDTAARAGLAGYPQKLEKLAVALGAAPKNSAGTRLINTFSKPTKGKRTLPEDKPEDWQQFIDYCIQDVITLREVDRLLPDFSPDELVVYKVDQLINDAGLAADLDMARAAIEAGKVNAARDGDRMRELLGIVNPGSVPQLVAGFHKLGLSMPDMRAATVAKMLARDDLTPDQREALTLRTRLSLTSSAKYEAVTNAACADGRVRGQFYYHGAHTGRWSGRGVQLQNLPRAEAKHPEAARLDLALGLGADADTLKGLVRSLFVGPFCVVDYSAIEARVLAWLAGETWAVEAFAAGRDIYVETAQRMGGLTRQQGKVAVLALGYQGGVHSLRNMGATGTDEELNAMKVQWRRANTRIVGYWSRIEEAFANGRAAGRVRFDRFNRDRVLVLPSGRTVTYHNAKRERWVVIDEETGRKLFKEGWRFDSPIGHRADTYGGRLTENIVQAVSRDLLADAMVKLHDQGHRVVLHVHDEIGIEAGPEQLGSITRAMCTAPEWADGLPLNAEGHWTERYCKG